MSRKTKAPTYHGSKCRNCGETERYVSTCNCIACQKRYQAARYAEMKAAWEEVRRARA